MCLMYFRGRGGPSIRETPSPSNHLAAPLLPGVTPARARPGSGFNVVPRRARPGLTGLRPHSYLAREVVHPPRPLQPAYASSPTVGLEVGGLLMSKVHLCKNPPSRNHRDVPPRVPKPLQAPPANNPPLDGPTPIPPTPCRELGIVVATP